MENYWYRALRNNNKRVAQPAQRGRNLRKESAIFHFQFQIMLCMIWSLFQLLKSDNAAQLKIQKQGSRLLPIFCIFLLTDTQLSDQGTVTVDVLLLQVSQHRTALTNHLQQTAARVVILLVYLQVLGQLLDAGGQGLQPEPPGNRCR